MHHSRLFALISVYWRINFKPVLMAKQTGALRLSGTVGGPTFYQMNGEDYVRSKSSLSGKKIKNSPRFERTMQNAYLMAAASTIASTVYRCLPRQNRYILDSEAETTTQAASTVKDDRDNITIKPACNPGNMQPYQQRMNAPSEMIYVVAGKNQVEEQEMHKEWVVP